MKAVEGHKVNDERQGWQVRHFIYSGSAKAADSEYS